MVLLNKGGIKCFFFHFEFWKLYVSYEAQKGNSKIVYQQEETFEKDQRCTKRHV